MTPWSINAAEPHDICSNVIVIYKQRCRAPQYLKQPLVNLSAWPVGGAQRNTKD